MAKSLDRYELRDVMGTGAFATVWRAYDPVLDQEVAIKVLADNWARDPEIRDRFLAEARVALQATSPHLVRVYHVVDGADMDAPYIVMELASGGTLEQRIRQRKLNPYTVPEALALLAEIARTVGALHENGLLHRDLKPGNVLFQERNGEERPLLGDFGLARVTDRSALTMVAGTPAYMAPEQAAGLTQLTEQADLYALGVMFLEMIGGETPKHRTMTEAANGLNLDGYLAEHHLELDAQVKAFVQRLLDVEPSRRPTSASEVIDQILMLRAGVPTDTTATVQQPQMNIAPSSATSAPETVVSTPGQRNKLIPLAAVGLVALVAGAVLLFALTGDGEQPAEQVESTTTTEPTTEATEAEPVTTTVPPETTTSIVVEPATVEPIAGAEIPNGFPIPPGALIERALSDGAFLRTYTIADTVAGIDSFYVDSGWTINARTESADLVEMTLSQDDQAVDVIISKLENTTGVTLVRLEVTPVR